MTGPEKKLTSGQILYRAREAKEISVETVSQHLRLDTSQIMALENDDYDRFAAAAYVRGHLRGYANFVGADADKVIQTYDRSAQLAPPLEPRVSQPDQQAASGDRHVRVVTFFLISLLILLLSLWWNNNRSGLTGLLDHEKEVDLILEEQGVDDPIQEVQIDQVSWQIPNQVEEPSASTSVVESEPQPDWLNEEPQPIQHEFNVVHLSDLPEVIPPETNLAEELEPDTAEVNGIEANEVAAEIGNEATQIATAEASLKPLENRGLVMQFTNPAWVQIIDADGQKHYSETGQAGEVINLVGRPPYRIIIGRASAVLLSYEGDFIDLEKLAKDGVARFTIKANGNIE